MRNISQKNRWNHTLLLGVLICTSAILSNCQKATEEERAESPVDDTAISRGSDEVTDPTVVLPLLPDEEIAIDHNEPVLHLTMDDAAADAKVTDFSARQRHQKFLDLTGNANTDGHSVPGVVDAAFSFDGEDDAIVVPAGDMDGSFDAGTDFSVAFWWRSDSKPFPDGYRSIISNYTPERGGIILYQRGNDQGTDKRIYMNFYVPGHSGPIAGPAIDDAENMGVWHHYVFQREGSTVRAWRDGKLQVELSNPALAQEMGGGNDFHINSTLNGAKGSIDSVSIYKRALSETEIRELATTSPGLDTLFSLAERRQALKTDPLATPELIERVETALQEKIEAEKGYPKHIGDKVDLLGFRYTHVAGNTYEMAFAFRANAPVEKNFHVYVHGYADEAHIGRVPERGGKPSLLQKWGFLPQPPTSAWIPGEVVIVRNRIETVEIPFDMRVNFLYHDEKKGWQQPLTAFVPLGWHAAL